MKPMKPLESALRILIVLKSMIVSLLPKLSMLKILAFARREKGGNLLKMAVLRLMVRRQLI